MSLDGDYDRENIFAKIVRGEIPSAKVFEDADVLSFMDAFPQSRGHALVISKRSQARNLLDVEAAALARLIVGVQTVARAIRAALLPDGLIVTQFSGAFAGQSVFHLHFHIIPRWQDVPLSSHGQAKMANPAELAELAASIAAKIV